MRAHEDIAAASELWLPGPADSPTDGRVEHAAAGDPQVLELAAEVLAQLADPTRLRLIRLLAVGEQDVSALAGQVPASRSSVSQHLGRLRLAGLVRSRRVGRRMLYRAASVHLVGLAEQAYGYAEHQLRPIPAHHRKSIG